MKTIYLVILMMCFLVGKVTGQSWTSLSKEATDLARVGRYAEAIEIYQQALSKAKPNSNEHTISLCEILDCRQKMGKKDSINQKLLDQAISTWKVQRDNSGYDYQMASLKLAQVLLAEEHYSEAVEVAKQVNKDTKSIFFGSNPAHLFSCELLASAYAGNENYAEANFWFEEAIKISQYSPLMPALNKISLYNNAASAFEQMGQYNKAKKLYWRVIEKVENSSSKSELQQNKIIYRNTVSNLAKLYGSLEAYDSAEYFYQQSQKIFTPNSIDEELQQAVITHNLANLYSAMGLYEKSTQFYEKANEVFEKYPQQAKNISLITLNNIAYNHLRQKNYSKAIFLYRQAVAKKSRNLENTTYALTLRGIGQIHAHLKNIDSANYYLDKADAIFLKIFDEKHSNHLGILNDKGFAAQQNKDFIQAEKYFLKAIVIEKNIIGNKHIKMLDHLHNLASNYRQMKAWGKADSVYKLLIPTKLEQLGKQVIFMSEREKKAFYDKNELFFNNFYVFALENIESDKIMPSVAESLFDVALTKKGRILESSISVRKKIIQNGDNNLLEKFNNWQNLINQIAQVSYLETKKATLLKPDSLQNFANQLEKELSLKSEQFKSFANSSFNWIEIQTKLQIDEVALQLLRFTAPNSKQNIDTCYIAMVLNKTDKPQTIIFRNGNELETQLLKTYQHQIAKQLPISHNLYQAFWQKIEEKLPKNTQKIYFSPDGVYNLINLNTLYDSANKQYLIDKYDFHLLGNLKEIMTLRPDQAPKKGQAALFSTLGFAKDEIKAVDTILQRKNWKNALFSDKEANKETLKSLRNPTILHIGAHGEFVTSSQQTEGMLASYLDFTVKGEKTTEKDILTASEISTLDLDSTQLVVLSACNTGLGTVAAGEGVYGLQRGFKVAGAKSIMMSLWEIDNYLPKHFTPLFYEKWLKKGNKRQAFRETQQEIRKNEKYKHPHYWGMFVLVGE